MSLKTEAAAVELAALEAGLDRIQMHISCRGRRNRMGMTVGSLCINRCSGRVRLFRLLQVQGRVNARLVESDAAKQPYEAMRRGTFCVCCDRPTAFMINVLLLTETATLHGQNAGLPREVMCLIGYHPRFIMRANTSAHP